MEEHDLFEKVCEGMGWKDFIKDCIPRFRQMNTDNFPDVDIVFDGCFTFNAEELDWWNKADYCDKVLHAAQKAANRLRLLKDDKNKISNEISKCKTICGDMFIFNSKNPCPPQCHDFFAFTKKLLVEWIQTLKICESSTVNEISDLKALLNSDNHELVNEYNEILNVKKEHHDYFLMTASTRKTKANQWIQDLMKFIK